MSTLLYEILGLKREKELSLLFSPFQTQEKFSLRAQWRSLQIAYFLIDEFGEIDKERVSTLVKALQQEGEVYYSEGPFDFLLLKRHRAILKKLEGEKSFYQKIKRFHKPLCHKSAEDLVAETVGISLPIMERDLRRAVLAACLTLLRQNVGSCFATAPAILIHQEQIENFLDDLYQLLSTGKLKRIFAGVEHLVPLSPTSGKKERLTHLMQNGLLKAWEFTLASFSEIKMEFSKWNLYGSLGFDPQEREGIGAIFYTYIQEKLKDNNEKTYKAHEEYSLAFDQLRAVEVLLRNASSASELRRLKAEHQTRHYHMQSCLDLRNEVHQQGAHYPTFFEFLIKNYSERFPDYFQEIYDAEIEEFCAQDYGDTPAGFRLIYKHGRREASVWTLIYNAKEWIDALVDFFLSVETQMRALADSERAQDDVTALTSLVVGHLRTEPFLQQALLRSAKRHERSDLVDFGKMQKKPWAYTSGGTMEILIRTYYRRENELTKEERYVESEIDLLIFLLDFLKSQPPSLTNLFLENPSKGILMQSPTHAFILHPGWSFFCEGWQDRGFTYTWVRDQFLEPRVHFFKRILLSGLEQRVLVENLLESIGAGHSHPLWEENGESATIAAFHKRMLQSGVNRELLDSFLYAALPLIPVDRCESYLRELLSQEVDLKKLSLPSSPFLTRFQFEQLAKQVSMERNPPVDFWELIAQKSAHLQIAPPRPLLFADSNWAHFHFAFVVNPSSGKMELWRVDRTGSRGVPMTTWEPFLNGSKKIPWVVYSKPHEYFA